MTRRAEEVNTENRKYCKRIAEELEAITAGQAVNEDGIEVLHPAVPRQMSRRKYTSPGGVVPGLLADMLEQPHLLIAGASGSGKSTLINGLIAAAARWSSASKQLILIDPKRVELNEWADLPHTIAHVTEPDDIVPALEHALDIIDGRYRAMQRQRLREYVGPDIYIIIDELADLMTTQRKAVTPLIQRICQIGRAARVHLIAATQCPLAKVIPTEIKVNFTAVCGLHTATRAHSRNIIDRPGCELLPLYGQCIYSTPQGLARYDVPYTGPGDIRAITGHYNAQRPALLRWLRKW